MDEENKFVIALDLSLSSTGICIGNYKAEPLITDTIKTNAKFTIDERLGIIWDKLLFLKEKYPPDIILIERGFSLYNTATQQLFRVHGITNLAFRGINQVYFSPNQIKKAITGDSKAKKEELKKFMDENYPNLIIKNLDESDSVALMEYYRRFVLNKRRKRYNEYDKAI